MKSVLLIEDDHDTRVSLRKILEAEGYFVFSAADGGAGLELLRRIKPPCLILLDCIMPMMNGHEFLEEIQRDPALHLIPVVVVSAFPEASKRMLAKAFIRKPIDLEVLLTVVREHCVPLRAIP
jgi:CheY-like chemotaxis protein